MTPNLSRNGGDNEPAFVVAPISVNGEISTRMLRARGPFPMIMSSAKSSIAEYRISSICRFNRCISSINNTSRSRKFVKIDAKSPARSIAGPDVCRKFTPSSFAIIAAKVVLPSPGGPYSKTWSRASRRLTAAFTNTDKFSFALS